MVDKDEIMTNLQRFFRVNLNDIEIDNDGLVSCSGNVEFTARMPRLPVDFLRVDGYFDASHSRLRTLQGSPHIVGSYFDVGTNRLTNLKGGPSWVGKYYNCEYNLLESLQGSPSYVGTEFHCSHNKLPTLEHLPAKIGTLLVISWRADLPLLRALQAPHVAMFDAPDGITEIINKYAGTGKPADVLRCASELTEHGFEANAEW